VRYSKGPRIFFGAIVAVFRTKSHFLSRSTVGVGNSKGVHGEFLIMRPLGCKTIPDNVPATQNALGLPVAVGLFQPLPRGVVDSGSGGSDWHCNAP